jgi:hypothetical protein
MLNNNFFRAHIFVLGKVIYALRQKRDRVVPLIPLIYVDNKTVETSV